MFLFQKFVAFKYLDGEKSNLHLFSELRNMLFNEHRLLQKNIIHLLWICGIKLQFWHLEACLKPLFCDTARQICSCHSTTATQERNGTQKIVIKRYINLSWRVPCFLSRTVGFMINLQPFCAQKMSWDRRADNPFDVICGHWAPPTDKIIEQSA